ncbi:MAG: hypothetical protein KAJ03_05215, partial [Gammaproteobacteria bacterium]|nr:hypothetical protein [Gammaproteobacteria bacterium]
VTEDARAEKASGRLQGSNRVDSREGIGRVESGTETEKTSGTSIPDRVEQAQRFLSVHAMVYNLFNLGRHLILAGHYSLLRQRVYAFWKEAVAI